MEPRHIANAGTEAAHQSALMQMCNLNLSKYPELKWFHAIPNGGSRGDDVKSQIIRGNQLKAQGVKAGICDLFLPVKRGQWSGLYVEMKKPGMLKNTSKEQKQFIDFVRGQDYAAIVCDSYLTAWDAIKQYLDWNKQ